MKGGRESIVAGCLEKSRDPAPSRVLFDPNANVKHEVVGLHTDDEEDSKDERCESTVL